jgi:DNA-binding NtrC family response regulator/tetratricopeptide (TPR) repeat protein
MDGLSTVAGLVQSGHFLEAAEALDRVGSAGATRQLVSVCRTELLERLGAHDESHKSAQKLISGGLLRGPLLARCEFTLGQVLWETAGDTERALEHVMRASSVAEAAGDVPLLCAIQLRLMVMLADSAGPNAAAAILGSIRRNVTRAGNTSISAAWHIFLGETEAKRGLTANARLHTERGIRLLSSRPNIWLSSVAENTLFAVSVLTDDYEAGLMHGTEALRLARESGAAAMKRAALSNLGMLAYLAGRGDEALDRLNEAAVVMPSTSERANARLDTMAKVLLSNENIRLAAECLATVEHNVRRPEDWLLYGNRYSLLTRAELLLQTGSLDRALESVQMALTLAERAEDDLLLGSALLARAEILVRIGRSDEACDAIERAAQRHTCHPPLLLAQYERTMGCALAVDGQLDRAQAHVARARRIYNGVRNAPGLVDLAKAWRNVGGGTIESPDVVSAIATVRSPAELLQDIASLVMHAGRPELVATTAVSVLAGSGHVDAATAIATATDGTSETLAAFSKYPTDRPGRTRALSIGASRGRSISIVVKLPRDLGSCAAVNAVQLLLGVVRDIERAHDEREERLTLWPIDDPADADGAVIDGRMRELMTLAQRVARTTVGILITGESGTGKEILARAIHRHSPRADKPFMPFNCTAVPKEMLESQLFGHRRGAFTGAERDHPGIIRAAKGGTLFLDEVGELSLDLQPKLLRFLESGEIAPLGEPSALTVDVRIVAATNRNLEQMVRDGRFREDLFYRLNIIPIAIPPLRERRDEIPALTHHFVCSAATEFQKGQIEIAEETMEQLLLYQWPGNIRQLQNEIRRVVALAEPDSIISPRQLSPEISNSSRVTTTSSISSPSILNLSVAGKLTPAVLRLEREMIQHALAVSQGHLETAAASLGISRKGLYLKRRRLGL